MREVTGYLTNDGVFYEGMDDAERHESTVALKGAYDQFVGHNGNFERFQNVIINLGPEIRRLLNAIEGPERAEEIRRDTDLATEERNILGSRRTETSKAREHPSDDGLRGTFETVEQQSH
jgi:hypothetical protein